MGEDKFGKEKKNSRKRAEKIKLKNKKNEERALR